MPAGDDVLGRLEAHLVQLRGNRLQHVYLLGRKAVAHGLVPIDVVEAVKVEPDLLELAAPVGARLQPFAFHGSCRLPAAARVAGCRGAEAAALSAAAAR